jgi:hypothetical protein
VTDMVDQEARGVPEDFEQGVQDVVGHMINCAAAAETPFNPESARWRRLGSGRKHHGPIMAPLMNLESIASSRHKHETAPTH